MGLMKTTVEIADSLFEEAKKLAEAEGLSLRQLMEDGLRTVIQRRRRRTSFTLRDGSFTGKGIRSELSWPELRQAIYQGRGE